MTILSIINELANEPSTNAKVEIIKREKDNVLLKKVFQAAYNPMLTYGIKKIPSYKCVSSEDEGMTLENAIEGLNVLLDRTETGNAAIAHLGYLLSWLTKDDAIVIERIIDRDLRCGTSDSLASRVWPGLVPVFDVMLSHKDISGIKFPAYGQIKSDGARCHMTRLGNKAVAFSRSGKPIELRGAFDEAICQMVNDGETLDGELLYQYADGEIADRKFGNGIVNKAVKNTISHEEASNLVFASWDIVDYTSTIPYDVRIERLTKQSNLNPNSRIYVLQTVILKDKEAALAFFETCLEAGEEGAMVKNIKHVWQPKRTKDLGKMKAEEVADLKIVSWYKGEAGKQFENGLGGYVGVTSDGLLSVNVGGGYSESYRLQDHSVFDAMVGRIISVTYNEVINSKSTGMHSLFLPRVDSKTVWLREDKDVANTLKELK